MADSSELFHHGHRNDILLNVNELDLSDRYPGKISLEGSKCWALLVTEELEPYMTIAELGQGRIISASHDVFARDLDQLHADESGLTRFKYNAIKWLSQGKDGEIMVINNSSQLASIPSNTKVIVYQGGEVLGTKEELSQSEEHLRSYIEAGGGFLIAVTPWGYKALYNCTLDDIPFHSLLKQSGISYHEEYLSVGQVKINLVTVNDYPSEIESHARYILKNVTHLSLQSDPGFLVSFSDHSFPIVLSAKNETFLAASTLGSGRIIVQAHDSNADGLFDGSNNNAQLKQLQINMLGWLSKGSISDFRQVPSITIDIIDDESVKKITSNIKVVIWNHQTIGLSEQSEQVVESFIENGGALLYYINPWAYVTYINEKYIPLSRAINKSGIAISGKWDYMYKDGNDFSFTLNEKYFSKITTANMNQAILRGEEEFLNSGMAVIYYQFFPVMIRNDPEITQQLVQIRRNYINTFNSPTPKEAITTLKDKSIVVIDDALCREKLPGCEITKGAFNFPNYPSETVVKNTTHVEITAYGLEDIYSTGCYLCPGESVDVQIIEGLFAGWTLQIGSHTDHLNPNKQEQLKRYPEICTYQDINVKQLQVFSPWGGLIYFISPKKSSNTLLKIQLSNVLLAPMFDLRNPVSVSNWNNRKQSVVPWLDVCGEFITLTLPTQSVQDVVDLPNIMRTWDRVVKLMHFLRGTDITKYRRQWIVSDVQPSAGYMHAGYPIVTELDITQPESNTFILGGNWGKFWGFFHEIGHNLQKDAWNFTGTIEKTCNIFSMFLMQEMAGTSPLKCEWLQENMDDIKSCISADDYDFGKWRSKHDVGLGIYAQLCDHLGWGCTMHVLRHYETLQPDALPNTETEKIDTWFNLYSINSERNLAPMFLFWDWPISETALEKVSHLVPYLPNDEMIEAAPKRVEAVLLKYPNLTRDCVKKEFPYVFE